MSATATRPRRKPPKRRRLGEMRAQALSTAPHLHGVVPEELLVEVMERCASMLRVASQEVDKLTPDKMMVDTVMSGRVPNEWVRLETDLRQEALYITSKMLGLEIDNRRAAAAEKMAELLAPVFKEVLDSLQLTAAQKKRAPDAIRGGLQVLEGSASRSA